MTEHDTLRNLPSKVRVKIDEVGKVSVEQGIKKPLFVLRVTAHSDVSCGHTDLATCQEVRRNLCTDYIFTLSNGFIITVWGFSIKQYDRSFNVASFELFGQKESISFAKDFNLLIQVGAYNSDVVSGRVTLYKGTSGSIGYEMTKLSDFELSKSGTVYKDETSRIVYNKARHAKELLLHR